MNLWVLNNKILIFCDYLRMGILKNQQTKDFFSIRINWHAVSLVKCRSSQFFKQKIICQPNEYRRRRLFTRNLLFWKAWELYFSIKLFIKFEKPSNFLGNEIVHLAEELFPRYLKHAYFIKIDIFHKVNALAPSEISTHSGGSCFWSRGFGVF